MINKVILVGNLGKDPEVRSLENGAKVAKFSIATNENYKDSNDQWQTRTEWHDVVAWRYLADRVERDLGKGKLVYVEGKLTHRKWEDKDGNPRYTTEVLANTVNLLEKRESSGGSYEQSSGQSTSAKQPVSTTTNQPENTQSNESDDLPF